ncbi:MAG: hypothetical protein NVS4B7_08450 [Ktedonobacteraceae bacterium]
MSDVNQPPQPEQVSPTDATVPDVPVPVSSTEATPPNAQASLWPPARPTFQRQETWPVGITILLVVLALLLITGGFGFILYTTTVQYRATLHTQATSAALSTVQARDRTQAQVQVAANVFATANSRIYATATSAADARATATAVADNTTATATAYDNIFNLVTSGTATLTDALSDNSGNNQWDETTGTVKGACVFISGVYHALEPQLGYYQPCMAAAARFDNFAYQVHMVIDTGNQDGIIFRANSSNGSFYLFRVGINGSYALDLYKNRVLAATLASGLSGDINTGINQGNDLAVIANGDILYLYINQQFLTSVTNSYLSSGKIGVIALNYRNSADAEFSNVQVWNVTASILAGTPAPAPSPTASPTRTATATGTP